VRIARAGLWIAFLKYLIAQKIVRPVLNHFPGGAQDVHRPLNQGDYITAQIRCQLNRPSPDLRKFVVNAVPALADCSNLHYGVSTPAG